MKYLKVIIGSSLFLVLVGCGTAIPKPVLINGQYHMPYKKKVEISNKGKKVNLRSGESYSCTIIGHDEGNIELNISNNAKIIELKLFKYGKLDEETIFFKKKNLWMHYDKEKDKDIVFGVSADNQSMYVITLDYKKETKKKDRRGFFGQCTQTTNNHPTYKYINNYRAMSDQELAMYIHNKEQAQRNSDKINKSLDDLNDDMKENNKQLNDMYQQNQNRNNIYNVRIVQ